MNNSDKQILNYIDDALECLLQGRYHCVTAAANDNPAVNQILSKLNELASDLSRIHGLVLRLGNDGLEKDSPEEGGYYPLQLQRLLSSAERRIGELEKSSATDGMTGMLNRQAGLRVIERRLEEAPPGEEHSLVFIDLDNLKEINYVF